MGIIDRKKIHVRLMSAGGVAYEREFEVSLPFVSMYFISTVAAWTEAATAAGQRRRPGVLPRKLELWLTETGSRDNSNQQYSFQLLEQHFQDLCEFIGKWVDCVLRENATHLAGYRASA